MNNLLETIDLEMRIAAASSVRENLQVAAEQGPHEVELSVIEALTDALITLRTQQIETMWLPRKAP